MRPNDRRVRMALVGSGALLSTTLTVAATAAAQTAAPEAPAAPVAVKADASLTVRHVRRHVLDGQKVLVKGTLAPGGGGHRVRLQVRTASGWTTVDRDATAPDGRYRLSWRPAAIGTRHLRVRFTGTATMAPARRRIGRVNVYRHALASWYGPGLYGGHLACGGTLTAGTLGVAHKSLPCGTKVTLRYGDSTVRVPVVDRGPYVGMREFDLTAATKARLGFGSTGTVLVTR